MSSLVGALTANPSIRSTPIRRCRVVTGTCTSLSRLTPKAEPTDSKTPTTRKRTPAMVTWRPIGSTSPKTASAVAEPSTATRRRVTTSVPEK